MIKGFRHSRKSTFGKRFTKKIGGPTFEKRFAFEKGFTEEPGPTFEKGLAFEKGFAEEPGGPTFVKRFAFEKGFAEEPGSPTFVKGLTEEKTIFEKGFVQTPLRKGLYSFYRDIILCPKLLLLSLGGGEKKLLGKTVVVVNGFVYTC